MIEPPRRTARCCVCCSLLGLNVLGMGGTVLFVNVNSQFDLSISFVAFVPVPYCDFNLWILRPFNRIGFFRFAVVTICAFIVVVCFPVACRCYGDCRHAFRPRPNQLDVNISMSVCSVLDFGFFKVIPIQRDKTVDRRFCCDAGTYANRL